MHDCLEIEGRLIDLVFGELEADEKLRLLAETESCANCLSARRALSGTLVLFDRAVETAAPVESYWQEYDARLRRKLFAQDIHAQEGRAPLWKRIFTSSLPVPVPVAAAVALVVLVITSVLALRSSSAETTTTPATSSFNAPALLKIVEVPVATERVVTRVVYVERKGHEKTQMRARENLLASSKVSPSVKPPRAGEEQSGFITRVNLEGFEPTSEVKIRMLTRSNEGEK